ncbi:polycystic kidney disease 2-like 2 protein isoform X4 [Cygnus olor]|uniref:polycystic kidney disease 2-like 2 protein isoform X4 n=1 Tax=Cygnus olor TaxID=8869 RepID=UPI001ADE4832|nr:polycystic kidney disease 2-like 2 protein isoform X4 [Cygnus olor]
MAAAAAEQRLSGGGVTKPRISCSGELELKTTLRELVVYLIFLITLCLVTFGMVSTNMYYLNEVMSRLFLEQSSAEDHGIDFESIRNMADFWKNFTKDCYSTYRYKAEDKSDFGLKNGSEWKYTSAPSLSPWYWGAAGFYSSGGFMFTLPKSKEESREKLEFLRQNGWLTRGTRVVFIDFSTYNANVNLFCIIRLVVEFPATGGALTSSRIYSVKLLRYISFYDYFLASCEIAFCLFIITFIVQEMIEIKKLKMEYFKTVWNWLDLLLVVVSILAIGFNIYRTMAVSLLMEKLLSDENVYPDFYFLAFWQILYDNMIAVSVFFAFMKIFKYVSFNKTMTQLSSTLSRCAGNICGFAVMFFIIFFAYAQLGYLVFGPQVEDFSTFLNCIFSQFRIVLGDFNFQTIEVNSILGPIYFISFVFFVFFILLNMFLAIINDTYSEVRADFAGIPSQEIHIKDLIRQSCNKTLVKLKLKKPEMGSGDENLKSKEFSSTKRKDISKPSKRGSSNEKSKLRKGRKHHHRIPPTDNADSGAASQSYVSPAEFQQLLEYTAELEEELNNANAKLNRIMKSIQQLKESSGKTEE